MRSVVDILKTIRPECEFEGVDDFFASGAIDSFDLTMLVSGLEERYGIVIDGADIVPEHFRNLEAIAQLVSRYGAVV